MLVDHVHPIARSIPVASMTPLNCSFAEQIKREQLLDETGFIVDDTLSIKITIRVLSQSETREYVVRKQVVIPCMHSVLLC